MAEMLSYPPPALDPVSVTTPTAPPRQLDGANVASGIVSNHTGASSPLHFAPASVLSLNFGRQKVQRHRKNQIHHEDKGSYKPSRAPAVCQQERC